MDKEIVVVPGLEVPEETNGKGLIQPDTARKGLIELDNDVDQMTQGTMEIIEEKKQEDITPYELQRMKENGGQSLSKDPELSAANTYEHLNMPQVIKIE